MIDSKKVFESFHNLILIYIALQRNDIDKAKVDEVLAKLCNKAVFYKWLIHRDKSSFFPGTNKSWFEKNLLKNRLIVISNGENILIRRPINEFSSQTKVLNPYQGYGELIFEYRPIGYTSLSTYLRDHVTFDKLTKLIEILRRYETVDSYPNIFCGEEILDSSSLEPFSIEFSNTDSLIVDLGERGSEAVENTLNNFILCFCGFSPEYNKDLVFFKEKYIESISPPISLFDFVINVRGELGALRGGNDKFVLDNAAAAALYMCISETEIFRRVEGFISQYHKFNKNENERYIYAVDNQTIIMDSTFPSLIDTVVRSLSVIPEDIYPSLNNYLHHDIRKYYHLIDGLVREIDSDGEINTADFKRCYPRISVLDRNIVIDSLPYDFSSVKLINISTNEMHLISEMHIVFVNSSEHIYYSNVNGVVYLIVVHSAISKIFASILKRFESEKNQEAPWMSYPASILDPSKIKLTKGFNSAIEVISIHRDVDSDQAKKNLCNWLMHIPEEFWQPIITLISAHVTMKKYQIDEFLACVRKYIANESNAFLIKNHEDFNGTYRLLYKDHDIGRGIGRFTPVNLNLGCGEATVIVDLIITGSQLCTALEHYMSDKLEDTKSNYFHFSEVEKENFRNVFYNLRVLRICSVLYTDEGVDRVRAKLKELTGFEINIEIECGTNITGKAYFGESDKIGESDKGAIRSMLIDDDKRKRLYFRLNDPGSFKLPVYKTVNDLNCVNLVARYQSLPKKCFKFLTCGVRGGEECKPLIRLPELNEKS